MIHVFVVGYFYIIKSTEFILFSLLKLQVCMFKIGFLTDLTKKYAFPPVLFYSTTEIKIMLILFDYPIYSL